MKTTCTTCRTPKDKRRKVKLHWELIGGLVMWRGVDGRKVYKGRCPACNTTFDIDGGKAE